MSYKRPRLSIASNSSLNDNGQAELLPRQNQPLFDGDELLESCTAMLSVPVEMIFRQVLNQGQLRPLLSRSEAQTFLNINILSEELDSFANLTQTLLKEQETSAFDSLIQGDHPQFRPIQVMLSSYHERLPTWRELSERVNPILVELERCRSVLRHCAEQNWSISQLLSTTPGTRIGTEKRKLSDIEDEICRRIQLILHGPTTVFDQAQFDDAGHCKQMSTMENYCRNIFLECTGQNSELRASTDEPRRNSKMPFGSQKDTTSRTSLDMYNNKAKSSSPASALKPARSLVFHSQETTTVLQNDGIDEDAILEDLVQQHTHSNDFENPKLQTTSEDTISQDLTSPEASPKQDMEKENEPSQSSHSSSVLEDAAFRSQNAAEVLSAFRKFT